MKRLTSTLALAWIPFSNLVPVLFVAGVKILAAVGQPIERRHRQIEVAVVDEPAHLPIEEGDEQRRNMGAVDVGVGHDDDAAVAQILVAVMRAGAAAERLREVGELLVLLKLVLAGGGDIEDFAAQRQDGLRSAVARLLGRAAGGNALDDKNLRPFGRAIGAVGELPRQPELAHRGLARDVFFLAAADALLGALDHEVEELVGLRRIAGEPMIEWASIACSTILCASAVASRSLVWPWNSGSRMNTESMAAAPVITSSLVMDWARLP